MRYVITLFFILYLTIAVQGQPALDSLKILPPSPTSADTIKLIGYILTANSAVKYDQTLFLADTTITRYVCYLNSQDFAYAHYKDTAVIGRLAPGNYKLIYIVREPTYNQVDSPEACRVLFPYGDTSVFHFTVSSLTNDVPIVSNETFAIYPNPVNDRIVLDIKDPRPSFGSLSILTIAGQRLCKQSIGMSGKSEVNIESLLPGMYFLVIQDEKQKWVKRFVKE